jgi:hypothetical protein
MAEKNSSDQLPSKNTSVCVHGHTDCPGNCYACYSETLSREITTNIIKGFSKVEEIRTDEKPKKK